LNTVNYIENTNIDKAKEAIDFINSLTDTELNDFYDKNLASNESDTRKKCGLGLAEMRLRTHQKIDCTFSPVDNKISAIFVQISI
jgi:Rod binding domain-containing protein